MAHRIRCGWILGRHASVHAATRAMQLAEIIGFTIRAVPSKTMHRESFPSGLFGRFDVLVSIAAESFTVTKLPVGC